MNDQREMTLDEYLESKLPDSHLARRQLQELRDALAALAVLGEPVAWVTADTVDGQTVNGKPRRVWWENNEGVGIPIYAAPQPAEQQPAPELYEALQKMVEMASTGMVDLNPHDEFVMSSARAALAAHRKQGGATE